MKKVIVIFGPTGIGKTSLSIEVAKKLDGEIISADSMQIYKDMNIGTAKITKNEMQNIPHHMLNIVSPKEEYSVGEYVKDVKKIIGEIFSRKKTPIIVGGTGLYINGLINNYEFENAPKNEEIRSKYINIAEEKGKDFIYNLLKKENPIRAEQIHPNDVKRVIRALEITEIKKISDEKHSPKKEKDSLDYEYIVFGLNMDKEKLYSRINARVDEMFEEGLMQEVENLLESGVKKENQSMQGIGYQEVIEGLENNLNEKEIKDLIKQHTRNYAKRQLTFMRKIKNLEWLDVNNNTKTEIFKKIKAKNN